MSALPPDEPNEEEKLEELPEDNGTPFQPAAHSRDDSVPPDDSSQGRPYDDTHPDTDTDIDEQELYDAGKGPAAAGASEPHDDPTVTGYNPPDETGNPS
jgi:hypothetical protein